MQNFTILLDSKFLPIPIAVQIYNFYLLSFQVATALLVAGSTLTFWIPWQTSFASTSSYSSVIESLGCSYNCTCMWLTCGLFQLMHVTWWPRCTFNWSSHGGPNEDNVIAALTTLPQGWVSTCKHQCTTVIIRCGQNLRGPFLRATLPMTVGSCARAMADTGDKRAHNSTTKVSFYTIIIRFCHCMIAITRV